MSVLAEGGETLRTDYHTKLYANRFAFPRGLSSYGQVDCYYVTLKRAPSQIYLRL
ncbi:predicted protein [Sclerotinia sclerotiorum 1980 UF-70]|uniref:Uncharacterized protein n=1 Tax=Sclerotinia sclerotiorum (strain ATCC 18683 / 1980 / Ss-1) TaxID=665079 RepID=A7F0X1_SCLS1|nr:predicted protein [Sclerotinia sclerotiorum 1980 UF-70]EDN95363.1 predicted protein [Sclerotinia sclerotiorum 1980 UF-70]